MKFWVGNKKCNNQKEKRNIIFMLFLIFMIVLFAFSISPVELQNDTFYTIKIGKHIIENGIDMMDPFSWHEGLPYTYPHWLYDVLIYLIYSINGFTSIYVSTVILAATLGITIFGVNKNLNKSSLLSFITTIGTMYLIRDFIAARAQLVTFILFVLAIFFIEKFMQGKRKVLYGLGIIIISLLIANLHVAVWPFLFILFLPYIVEQFIIYIYNLMLCKKIYSKISSFKNRKKLRLNNANKTIINESTFENVDIEISIKKEKSSITDSNKYKIIFEKNNNIKYLFIILIISILMGCLTPLKEVPYTYLYKTMIGNTTQCINEHLPLTLIENKPIMGVMILIIGILMLTKIKIRFKDFCMIFGLLILTFISRRQISLFLVIGNIFFLKMIIKLLENKKLYNLKKINQFENSILTILLITVIIFGLSWLNIKDKLQEKYINETIYPVEASKYIKEELIQRIGIENLRLFNEYNYGSYLLLNDIPVFIDSRADLYAPEFNGIKTEEGIYEGKDIFSDFINVSSMDTYYEMVFDKYDVNYVILYRPTKLNIILCRDDNYDIEYIDENFVVYKRNYYEENY